jgi:hypothetical protein
MVTTTEELNSLAATTASDVPPVNEVLPLLLATLGTGRELLGDDEVDDVDAVRPEEVSGSASVNSLRLLLHTAQIA